jgi:hypothetical protein
MSGDNVPQETPTLEMRLAAIEDKLARLTVTEEEMAAYSKVAGLAASRGGGSPAPVPALSPRVCSISSPVSHCWVYIQNCYIAQPIVVNDCIQFLAGSASSGGGFARLGGG